MFKIKPNHTQHKPMALTSQSIAYTCDGKNHSGYLAWDGEISAPQPGIMVVHEWWGLNDYVKRRADMLAAQGFCALAIDMYGDGKVAENPQQAGAMMNLVLEDMTMGTARLKAGYNSLISQSQVDSNRTAAIGYCFGGAMVLHMARIGIPLNAVASFHGALGSFHRPEPDQVEAAVLVCHGADDAMVSMDDVASFRQEMDAANAKYEVILHPGAQHGFSSTEADENGRKYAIPLSYNKVADDTSWAAMLSLFERTFNS